MLYATRWEQAWLDEFSGPEDERTRHTRSRLVVVEADSAEEAAEKSGLVVERFHKATSAEVAEWDGLVGGPLSARDVKMLLSLVSADIREIRRKRKRDRITGRWPVGSDDAFDSNRARAYRLLCMSAKLDVLLEDAEDEDGEYNGDNDGAANAARNGGKDVVVPTGRRV